jgi:hypothetical protein
LRSWPRASAAETALEIAVSDTNTSGMASTENSGIKGTLQNQFIEFLGFKKARTRKNGTYLEFLVMFGV